MERAGVFNLAFSSSTTVYDEANISPLDECMPMAIPN
jgi:UDP-glucose 4-epimerase